ncbi:MAG: hypothetical protein LBK59_12420 [Bifidobacteriaceae bacterium]|nr:hypothetical protein [Bifidobacteriaceae bacterium]
MLVLAAVLALGLGIYDFGKGSAWGGDEPLGPLVDDPLAAKDLLGLTLSYSEEIPQTSLDYFMSIEGHWASVERRFEAGPWGLAGTVERIVAYAQDSGWTVLDLEYYVHRAEHSEHDQECARARLSKPVDGRRMLSYLDVRDTTVDSDGSVTVSLYWQRQDDTNETVPTGPAPESLDPLQMAP